MAALKKRKYALRSAYREMLRELLNDDGKTRPRLAREMRLRIRRLQIALRGEAVAKEVVVKIAEWLAKQTDQDGKPRFTGTWSDLCDEVMEAENLSPASAPRTPGADGYPSEASGNSGPRLPPFRQTAVHLDLPDEIDINGGRPLVGAIEIQGARNTLPKQLIAALLTRKKCVLHCVPNLTDMLIVAEMIWRLGGTVHRDGRSIVVSTANISADNMSHLPAFHKTTRVSMLLLAPLLHRFKKAFVPMPGGCRIGERDVTFHLEALKKMGATIEVKPDGICASAPNGLEARVIDLPHPSVGATEQILLAGALAHGTTKISNAAIDPEVIDLARCLKEMGCHVSWNRQREIEITGNRLDEMGEYDFTPMNDRSEIGSWACAALAAGITEEWPDKAGLLNSLEAVRKALIAKQASAALNRFRDLADVLATGRVMPIVWPDSGGPTSMQGWRGRRLEICPVPSAGQRPASPDWPTRTTAVVSNC